MTGAESSGYDSETHTVCALMHHVLCMDSFSHVAMFSTHIPNPRVDVMYELPKPLPLRACDMRQHRCTTSFTQHTAYKQLNARSNCHVQEAVWGDVVSSACRPGSMFRQPMRQECMAGRGLCIRLRRSIVVRHRHSTPLLVCLSFVCTHCYLPMSLATLL